MSDLDTAREEITAQLQREYIAYLCSMSDHGCACVALNFEAWAEVPR